MMLSWVDFLASEVEVTVLQNLVLQDIQPDQLILIPINMEAHIDLHQIIINNLNPIQVIKDMPQITQHPPTPIQDTGNPLPPVLKSTTLVQPIIPQDNQPQLRFIHQPPRTLNKMLPTAHHLIKDMPQPLMAEVWRKRK